MSDVPPRQHVSGSDSIRMTAAEGLPHYDDPSRDEVNSPSSQADASQGYLAVRGQQSEAYAIFQAFNKYVEAERQRAQRRTTTIIVGFAVIVLLLLAGFFAVWTASMRDMHETQTALLHAAMENAKAQQVDVGTAIAAAVEKADERVAAERAKAEKAKAELEVATKALQEKLDAEKAAAAANEAKVRAEESAALNATLAKMNAALEEVRKDNEALKKENAAVREAMAKSAALPRPVQSRPQVAPKPVPAQQPVASQPAAPKPVATSPTAAAPKPVQEPQPYAENRDVAPAITIKRAKPPTGFSTGTLPIPTDKDAGGTVHWRVMLPNEVL